MKLYVAVHEGDLPSVLVESNNQNEAKEAVYKYYKIMDEDVKKIDICVFKIKTLIKEFGEKVGEDWNSPKVCEIPLNC